MPAHCGVHHHSQSHHIGLSRGKSFDVPLASARQVGGEGSLIGHGEVIRRDALHREHEPRHDCRLP